MPQPVIFLQNGIKLIHQPLNSPIAHFGILINAGSRDDPENLMGLAHFIEHTIFKGTKKRKSFQILKRLEDVGGELNASSSKEETYYHASFLTQDYQRTLELLSDIFFNATFPEIELEKEKKVIYEEINYYADSPAEAIFDDFETIVFQNHPLANNILGTKKSLKNFKQNDIFNFINQQYLNQHVVLSSIGNISTQQLTKLCTHYFTNTNNYQKLRNRVPFSIYQPKNIQKSKKNSQTHILLGNIAYPFRDKNRDTFALLTNLLGGQGMSTRLNMTLREKQALAYTVEANFTPLSDTGLFSIYIGCDHHTAEKCINLTYKELKKLSEQKLGTLQLQYAKKQLIGQIAIASESKLLEMLANGRNALFYDEVENVAEVIQKIEKITAEEILDVANEIFKIDQFSSLIYSK